MVTPEDGQCHAPDGALLAAIADSSDDAIVATTLSGIVTRWSPAAERIYGYEAERWSGGRSTSSCPRTAAARA